MRVADKHEYELELQVHLLPWDSASPTLGPGGLSRGAYY